MNTKTKQIMPITAKVLGTTTIMSGDGNTEGVISFPSLHKETGTIVHIRFTHLTELNYALIDKTYKHFPDIFETPQAEYEKTSMLSKKDFKKLDEIVREFINTQIAVIIEVVKKYNARFYKYKFDVEIITVFDEPNQTIIDSFIEDVKKAVAEVTQITEKYDTFDYDTFSANYSYSLIFRKFILNSTDTDTRRYNVIREFFCFSSFDNGPEYGSMLMY